MKLLLPLLGLCGVLLPFQAASQTISYTPMMTGSLGLNVIPNARMDEAGIITAGATALKPYTHAYLGFQIAEPLYINLRQSAETTNPFNKPERLYPGMDLKFRLLKENRFQPEIAVGLNSAIGHQRMASEYIALSKRYNNLDFTAGMGWGRMGSAGHIDNPLKIFSNHFGKSRPKDGEIATDPQQWFTGNTAGFFAGLEYFTPIDGLSLKADWGGDTYAAESDAISGFDTPQPWSIGLSYSPADWINTGIAMQGLDRIMARISLKSHAGAWPFGKEKGANDVAHLRMAPHRTSNSSATQMEISARNNGIALYGTRQSDHHAIASLSLASGRSTPAQIRESVIAMSNQGGKTVEAITIHPTYMNLKGPAITLNRRDLENALAHNKGSVEEIWRSATISSVGRPDITAARVRQKRSFFNFVLDNRFSLSEEDSGFLYRTSLIANYNKPHFFGLLHSGTSIRFNLADNLEELQKTRLPVLLPVRSNEYDFANQFLGLERSYIGATYSITPELHLAANAGYLEEMYGGFGGEILYRPFGKRYAFGAESWLALKRDPLIPLNLGFNGDSLLSGHLNAWYEFPEHDMTLKVQAGRYLAEDMGLGFTLTRNFDSGVKLEGFTTLSDTPDIDPLGGTTYAYSGIRMVLPLGGVRHVPEGSAVKITAAPLGRDYGQSLDNPLPLYEATEPLSYRHIVHHWKDIGGS